MIIDFSGNGGGGSGSGGSVVNVTQLLSAGTPSATITVDGQATTIYSNEQEKQNYQIVNSLNDIENPVEGYMAWVKSYQSGVTVSGMQYAVSDRPDYPDLVATVIGNKFWVGYTDATLLQGDTEFTDERVFDTIEEGKEATFYDGSGGSMVIKIASVDYDPYLVTYQFFPMNGYEVVFNSTWKYCQGDCDGYISVSPTSMTIPVTVKQSNPVVYNGNEWAELQNYQIVGSLDEITNPVEGMVAIVNTKETKTYERWKLNFQGADYINDNTEEMGGITLEIDGDDYYLSWEVGASPYQYPISYYPAYRRGGGEMVEEEPFYGNIETPENEWIAIRIMEMDMMEDAVSGDTQTFYDLDENGESGTTIEVEYQGEQTVIVSSSSTKYTYTGGAWVEDVYPTEIEYYTWDALKAMTVAERTALKDRISAGTLVIITYQDGDTQYHFPSQMDFREYGDKWLMWRCNRGQGGLSRCLRIKWNTTEYQSEDEQPYTPPTYYKIADGDEEIGYYEPTDPNTPIWSYFDPGYMIAKKGNNLPPFKETTVPRYSFDFDPSEATDGDVIFTLEDGNGQIATVYYFNDNGTNKIGFSAETQDYDWITDGELDLDSVDYRYNLLVIGQKPYTSVMGYIGGKSILIRWDGMTLGITVTEDAYTGAFSEDFSIIPNDQLSYGSFNDEYDFRLELEQSLYLSEPNYDPENNSEYFYDYDDRRLRRINPVSSDQIRNIVKLTQAEYDDLEQSGEIREDTLYLIEEE